MNYQILAPGTFSALQVSLDPGDKILTEAGTMAWMDPSIQVKTSSGGLMAGLRRAVLRGDSFFQNEYTSTAQGGKITLVAGQPGEIKAMELRGAPVILERGAYLAHTPGVSVDAKFNGLKGFFAEGLFVVYATGEGTLFYNAYGDILEVDVQGDYIVDNGYAVAWESSLNYTVTRTGRKIRTFLFGDGLVIRFSGHGKVWVQSRSAFSLANFMHPFRAIESKNS
ncbi:TIGR00266 family protein [bacterium]|nr:TIGR00266 family protein [bacterium]